METLVEIFQASYEPEVRLVEDILKQEGLHPRVSMLRSQEFLRAAYGGAQLPFGVWIIQVPEHESAQAAPIIAAHASENASIEHVPERTARKVFRYAMGVVVFLFFAGVVYSLIIMFQSILKGNA